MGGDWALYEASPLRSGKFSPGFNTLPEFEKPSTGFQGLLGDQPPLGFWDPVGFSKDGDLEKFKRRREVEIKHGRVSMLATIGYMVPEYVKLPGYLSPSMDLSFQDVPNGLGALSKVPTAGWAQIFAFVGAIELGYNKQTGEPGNYGKGFLGLGSVGVSASIEDPEVRSKKLSAELAKGRLAMVAIIGMFFQDGLTGSAWGDWANYVDSPLRAFENETGVQPPVGFWDPLGLSADGSEFTYKRRREVELKHGRISMAATIGYMFPEYYKFSGYLSPTYDVQFSDVPNGLGALSKVPALGWCQIVGFAGLIELNVYNEQVNGEPGNYGAGFLGMRSVGIMSTGFPDPEVRKKKLNAELANGRLAMMAIIGMFFQDGLTGSAWGDWATYTGSPLRAFENELGVQAPVGFWDPAGFAADGNVENFNRRRQTELKHGRLSMLATMGYITPELTGKFPGYLSPSTGLKFADIPNGLAAISKVPAAGWAQIVAYSAFCELSQDQSPGTAAAAGDFGFKVLTSSDPAEKTKKLSAEIANGRLAMMAIMGMLFQDGLTGSAWGDWALYTASPLRAFESELGVQAPVGYWDPLGLSKDGDAETFRRRRQTEIKHGRVSMLATMGYITPELVGKFPGYLSPGNNLKFADVPNGLAALSKVPGPGWLQILFYGAYCEAGSGNFGWFDSGSNFDFDGKLVMQAKNSKDMRIPGDCGWRPPLLATDDPELKKKRLSAEIANGRLAMMAIIGMFFQDGLTGSAWGDWANYTA